MKNYVKKAVIYRGRLYNSGETITADPATLAEWQKNGIISSDAGELKTEVDDMETALHDAIARIEVLESERATLVKDKDSFEAAQNRVRELEDEIASLKSQHATAEPIEPGAESASPSCESSETPQAEAVSAPTPPGLVEGGTGAEGAMPGRDSRKKDKK